MQEQQKQSVVEGLDKILQKETQRTEKKDMKQLAWIGCFLFGAWGMASEDSLTKRIDDEFKISRFSASWEKPDSNATREAVIPLTSETSQELSVIVSEQGFFPKEIFGTRDVPLKIFLTSAAEKSLCFVMEDFHIYKQVTHEKVEEVFFVPRVSGRFRFYCPMDGIEGAFYVRDPH